MNARSLGVLAPVVLAAAYMLKRHYSDASPEALLWILRPTAAVTEVVLGRTFVWQSGAGYFSPDFAVVIAKSCAGVNFLIIAFVTLALGFAARFGSHRARLLWALGALAVAYAATVVANTARIALSIGCAHAAARWLGWSFQAAHRALGVAVYLVALLALVHACRRVLRSESSRGTFPLSLGLATYAGFTLIVPWLRGAAATPGYAEHALAAGLGVLAVAALTAVPYLFKRRSAPTASA
jgi:exosortase K